MDERRNNNCKDAQIYDCKDNNMAVFDKRISLRRTPLRSKSFDLGRNTWNTENPKLFKCNTVHQEYFEDFCLNENPVPWRKSSANYTLNSFFRLAKLNSRLLDAVENGDVKEIARLLNLHANPNATCRLNHISVCHLAATVDNESLSLLIQSGAESVRADRFGRTPLHLAAWTGRPKQIAVLLGLPEEVKNQVELKVSNETILEVKKHSGVKHQLIEMSCNIGHLPSSQPNWFDSIEHNCMQIKENLPIFEPGWTALHAASARCHHSCVQLLLAAGADPSARDFIGRTPLDVAGRAHCSGYTIDVHKDTIRFLVAAGGNFNCNHLNRLNPENTPLHTAVALESLDAIKELLDAGVSPTCLNSDGLTAMHICVEKLLREPLQLLLEIRKSNDRDPDLEIVDAKDEMGLTVLHSAVRAKWIDGVYLALGAAASVCMKSNDGETAIHTAAATGDTRILQELINVARYAIHHRNQKGQTALIVAIINNNLETVIMLIENGASLSVTLPDQQNVLHIAAQYGHKEILEYLLHYGGRAISSLLNAYAIYTPITYAIMNNFPECVKLLLLNGAVPDSCVSFKDHFCSQNCDTYTTDLHIAVAKNHCEIVEIILEFDAEAVNKSNSVGLLPLDVACLHGSRESIEILLSKGADLSRTAAHIDMKPIEILMDRLSKPVEYLEANFDLCIHPSEEMSVEDQTHVLVNYQILWPDPTDMKQMKVIKSLVDTGNRYDQRKLLQHPLIESFLHLKWKALQPVFYFIIILYALFVFSLNVYVVTGFYLQDKFEQANKMNASTTYTSASYMILETLVNTVLRRDGWQYMLYVTASLVLIQEIIFIWIRNKRYFLLLENWVKFTSIVLSMSLPSLVSWWYDLGAEISRLDVEWARLIASLALLLTWMEMMFLLSRFPNWGFYVLMFATVAAKVSKILLTFMFIIIGFSLCFMIQFRGNIPFDSPWAAVTRTLVMLMGEYEYDSMIKKVDKYATDKTKVSSSIEILRLIFIAFMILASVVLMNLIIGVAVNDVNTLEMIGKQRRLEKQVEFLASLEDIVWSKPIQRFMPEMFMSRWKQVHMVIILGPEKTKGFPSYIKDAIFEKAKIRQHQIDEEQELYNNPIKPNEIKEAIASLDDKIRKLEGTVNVSMFNETFNKINKQIEELRKEMINQFVLMRQIDDKSCNGFKN